MRRFKSTDFTSRQGHWVAEASELGFPPGSAIREFEMETINQVARFTFDHSFKDINGDVMYWYYESDHLPGRVGPMTAFIYND